MECAAGFLQERFDRWRGRLCRQPLRQLYLRVGRCPFAGEGIYATPLDPIGTGNTAAARVACTFKPGADTSIEVAASGWHGGLNSSCTANIADKRPITALTFYNDYSLIKHKSDRLPYTWMNVSGVSVAAGGLFTYFDFVSGCNRPFIGGTAAVDGKVEHRLNLNFGYGF